MSTLGLTPNPFEIYSTYSNLLVSGPVNGQDPAGEVRATALHSLLRLQASGFDVPAETAEDCDRYARAYGAELGHRRQLIQELEWDTGVCFWAFLVVFLLVLHVSHVLLAREGADS